MQNTSLVRREICLLVLNVDIAGAAAGKKKRGVREKS
jgi:hypothetical protein